MAYLVVETEYHYNGGEYTVVRKEPEDVRKCALVYYGCNKSRLVPICDLEILEDEENEQRSDKAQDKVLEETCMEYVTDVHETPNFVEVHGNAGGDDVCYRVYDDGSITCR